MTDLPPARSLWETTAIPAPLTVPFFGTASAQVAIVGAGYTGLSAALHLAKSGLDVALLDTAAPGWGASGRNGGQVIAGLKHDPETLASLLGEDAGARVVQTVGGGPDLVFALVARHDIPCDPVRTGWLQLAVSDATKAVLRDRVRQWQAHGAEVELLDAAALRVLGGTDAYVAAMLDPRGGTVQPLSYVRGLAGAAAHAGARLLAPARVARLESRGKAWRLHTASGSISADRVILAANAYADALHPAVRRSVIPVPSWQMATNPLPLSLRLSILPQGQSGSDMRRLLRYFRLDSAGRFLIGSRGAFADPQPAAVLRRLARAARAIFPQLVGIPFAYHWGGLVAMTADHLPRLHVLAPNLFAGFGYNGRGVALATVMGRELAALAAGTAPEALGLPCTNVKPIRLHAATRLGVRALVQWYRLLDAID